MSLKEFVSGEIRKALGRLRATVMFALKAVFVLLVNVVFWFLPLVLAGYLLGTPVLNGFNRPLATRGTSIPIGHDGRPMGRPEETKRAFNVRETSSLASQFMREIRLFRRS